MRAQERPTNLTGTVRDAETRELLPAVNIRVCGTSRGTTTNVEGAYRIVLPVGTGQLIFSCIGYHSDTVHVASRDMEWTEIALRPTVLPLEEVTVYAEGRNAAESIIRKAIQKKIEAELGLKAYAFKAYTKTTLRVPREREGTKDTIIAGLLETQTEGFWEHPDQYKEIITARRQSANFSAAQNVFAMGRLPNLNDNTTVIGQLSVVGPTSPEALDYYSFEMVDTLAIDRRRVFCLRMRPKSTVRPLFTGTIAIADESFRVMQVDVGGNEALDVPPYEKLHIRQQFSLYADKYWLPIESCTDFCVQLALPAMPPLLWRQASLVSDYEIGDDTREIFFDEHLITALPIADRVDSSRWASSAVVPLTREEKDAYRKLDSIMTNAGVVTQSLVFLSRLPVAFRGLPLTEFPDFFHFNRVEGAYIGGGVDLSRILDLTEITLAGGYGIADGAWKYGARVEHFFSPSRAFSLGAELHRTMRYREGDGVFTRGTITLLALLDKSDPVDYFLGEGFSVFSSVRAAKDLKLGLQYLDERQSSVSKQTEYSILRPSATFRANPPISDGRYRTLLGSITYDTRKFIDAGLFETLDESQDATLLSMSAEFSGRGILKSPSAYERYMLELNHHMHAFGAGRLTVTSSLGTSKGDLPPQRQFDVQAQAGGIAPAGAFKCARVKGYAGSNIATLQLEYNFGVLPFRAMGIPSLRNLELIAYSGTAWCDRYQWSAYPEGKQVWEPSGPYQEAGFGVEGILSFFRLDFTWRFTHRTGDDFTITLGSALF